MSGDRLGSFGATACTGNEPVKPFAQVATPELLTEIGPMTLGPATLHRLSHGLCDQSTGSGVTVTGAELNVPVATSCAVPFLATAGLGLMEIDSSTRLEPPQLATNNPQSKRESAPTWRSRYICGLQQASKLLVGPHYEAGRLRSSNGFSQRLPRPIQEFTNKVRSIARRSSSSVSRPLQRRDRPRTAFSAKNCQDQYRNLDRMIGNQEGMNDEETQRKRS